jgi:hypothetical protein
MDIGRASLKADRVLAVGRIRVHETTRCAPAARRHDREATSLVDTKLERFQVAGPVRDL